MYLTSMSTEVSILLRLLGMAVLGDISKEHKKDQNKQGTERQFHNYDGPRPFFVYAGNAAVYEHKAYKTVI